MQDFKTQLALRDLAIAGHDWLHAVYMPVGSADELSWYLNANHQLTKVLRGRKMATVKDLFDECAAALQFPSYFGENWAAFHECMTDLSWLQATSYVLIITDASEFLVQEDIGEIRHLVNVFKSIAESWSIVNHPGSTWNHSEVPFHVVLQEEPDDTEALRRRLSAFDVAVKLLNRQ